VVALASTVTEFNSNAAACNMLLPIVAELSVALQVRLGTVPFVSLPLRTTWFTESCTACISVYRWGAVGAETGTVAPQSATFPLEYKRQSGACTKDPPQVNPMAFMIATTISTSFAFMLPIGTPPNAIVFATKQLTIMDMLSASHPSSCPRPLQTWHERQAFLAQAA
jgi:hypothetical protein